MVVRRGQSLFPDAVRAVLHRRSKGVAWHCPTDLGDDVSSKCATRIHRCVIVPALRQGLSAFDQPRRS